jgi:holo-[acyl-carrier protein] synthase
MSSTGQVGELYILRSGVDIVELSRLEGLKPAIRKRFLERVFTPLELANASASDAALMGRFAAKEAVAKALGCGIGKVGWKEVEILEDEEGAPQLSLHGNAKELAKSLRLKLWSISISHSRTHAVAMAVALGFSSAENG